MVEAEDLAGAVATFDALVAAEAELRAVAEAAGLPFAEIRDALAARPELAESFGAARGLDPALLVLLLAGE